MGRLDPKTAKHISGKCIVTGIRKSTLNQTVNGLHGDNEDKTNDTLKVKMKHDGQKWSILDFEDSTSKQHSPFTHHTDIRNTFPWLPLF